MAVFWTGKIFIMRVGLFIPCYIDQFYPQVGMATLQLLEKLGIQVVFPKNQTCCGQPMANSGCETDALPVYRHFVSVFQDFDYVVGPSGSCVFHVKKHYDVLEQTQAVKEIRGKTYDLCDFLVEVLKVQQLGARFPYRVGLHQSCHGLRGLRQAESSERVGERYSRLESLLSHVKDLELVTLDRVDECCGFGGTFSVSESAVSIKMGKDRVMDHYKSKAEVITSGDMSCLMHLQGVARAEALPIKTMHIAEILNSRL